ncbi:MAG: ABC transporter ATP-binding protein [Sphingobacteriales bacterium]|nr:MAG: ABC transporter ATP-binding protein [Sphingobacteriales bacterium]
MISIAQLHKTFGNLKVLKDINIAFDQGQVVAVIGPNGSGKTTFIKCLLGMVMPNQGQIFFNGKIINNDWSYRSQIGYMPQIGRYPDNMKVGQLFEMMKDIRHNSTGNTQTDEDLLKSFNMESIFHKPMRTLSGGTRQKVSACLAFLFNPPVLILDEPTTGLDPLSAEILKLKIAREKENNKLILITSHILSDLDELVTDVMYIFEGDVFFYKPLEELKTETGEEKLGKAIAKIIKQGHQIFQA